MKKISLLVFSASVLFHLSFNPAAFGTTVRTGITAEEVLKGIQSRYEKINDVEANFTQEYIGKGMKQTTRGEGKVYFKKKGMMRWDYTTPHQKLVSNGRTFWFYQPDEKQVLVSSLSSVVKERTPLAFLAGEGDISRDFNVLNLKESISESGEVYVLELTPKEPLATFSKLVVAVDRKTFTVLQADVFDAMGNVTRTRFSDIQVNVGLSDSLFQFAVPRGTEVIKMQEPAAPAQGKGAK